MSRRKRRYNNRQIIRNKNKINVTFEDIASFEALYNAAQMSAKGVRWKVSVQKYILNIFSNISKTRQNLLNGKDVRLGFIEFDICERGKARHIRSVHFAERVVQKSLCANALNPVLTKNLIYDNSASQKGKGVHFATDRVIKHLQRHYRKHGNSGYVLMIDFKSYFDNIEHAPLKEIICKYFKDEKIRKLSFDFIDAFGDKGLGLGSETSQIFAVAYINEIDHYIKERWRIKGYGRYMDDSYIIHESKEQLKEILKDLLEKYAKYGIKISPNKTRIIELKKGFTFLKTRFFLTNTGKVIKKPCRRSITCERKRLKRQAKLFYNGILPMDRIEASYQSWLGSMKHRNAARTIESMKNLYKKLFEKKGE